MGVQICEICTHNIGCQLCGRYDIETCGDFAQWSEIHYYGLEYVDDNGEFEVEILIAVNKKISNYGELMKIYNEQIKPYLFCEGDNLDSFTEYGMGLENDDAEMATYIFLD